MAPFGYLNAKETGGKGVLKIDESKAFIVKKIFRDYLSGIPRYLISEETKKLGFKHTGNGAIARILRNPLYAGLVRVSPTEKEPEKLVKGLHPPIISPQQYWRAQELLDDKRLTKSQPKEEFPLKGIIRSSCCGRLMTAGWSKGKYKYYMYYRCIKHSNMNIPGILLHDKFDELLGYLNFTQNQISKITNLVKTGLKEALNIRKVQLEIKEKDLLNVEARTENIEEKFINNEINKDTFQKWSRKYTIEKSRLKEELKLLKSNFQDEIEKELEVLPNLLNLKDIYKSANINQQHSILNAVFKHGLVFHGDAFRTLSINPAFNDNLLITKEKGLLFLEQPSDNFDRLSSCAEEEIRTPKPFRALPPQSSASTSFATSAGYCGGQK